VPISSLARGVCRCLFRRARVYSIRSLGHTVKISSYCVRRTPLRQRDRHRRCCNIHLLRAKRTPPCRACCRRYARSFACAIPVFGPRKRICSRFTGLFSVEVSGARARSLLFLPQPSPTPLPNLTSPRLPSPLTPPASPTASPQTPSVPAARSHTNRRTRR